jgi:hypothetical protein
MAPNVADKLESLSGYRHVFSPGDAQAASNPIVFSYLKLVIGGRTYYVLSRICDAGLDYTQRTNKFAHHLVLDQSELPAAGPAWLLATDGVMSTQWDGPPRILPNGRAVPKANLAPQICRGWQTVTGDAGWGGVLAESSQRTAPTFLVFKPGMNMLRLLVETQSLLPPRRRWAVTFSTYFTKLPPGVDCQWRCVLQGSPEAKSARAVPDALVIDLTKPLGPAEGGALVAAARTGVLPAQDTPASQTGVRSRPVVTQHVGEPSIPEPSDDDYELADPFTKPPPARRTVRPRLATVARNSRRKRPWILAAAGAAIMSIAIAAAIALLYRRDVIKDTANRLKTVAAATSDLKYRLAGGVKPPAMASSSTVNNPSASRAASHSAGSEATATMNNDKNSSKSSPGQVSRENPPALTQNQTAGNETQGTDKQAVDVDKNNATAAKEPRAQGEPSAQLPQAQPNPIYLAIKPVFSRLPQGARKPTATAPHKLGKGPHNLKLLGGGNEKYQLSEKKKDQKANQWTLIKRLPGKPEVAEISIKDSEIEFSWNITQDKGLWETLRDSLLVITSQDGRRQPVALRKPIAQTAQLPFNKDRDSASITLSDVDSTNRLFAELIPEPATPTFSNDTSDRTQTVYQIAPHLTLTLWYQKGTLNYSVTFDVDGSERNMSLQSLEGFKDQQEKKRQSLKNGNTNAGSDRNQNDLQNSEAEKKRIDDTLEVVKKALPAYHRLLEQQHGYRLYFKINEFEVDVARSDLPNEQAAGPKK